METYDAGSSTSSYSNTIIIITMHPVLSVIVGNHTGWAGKIIDAS